MLNGFSRTRAQAGTRFPHQSLSDLCPEEPLCAEAAYSGSVHHEPRPLFLGAPHERWKVVRSAFSENGEVSPGCACSRQRRDVRALLQRQGHSRGCRERFSFSWPDAEARVTVEARGARRRSCHLFRFALPVVRVTVVKIVETRCRSACLTVSRPQEMHP